MTMTFLHYLNLPNGVQKQDY